MPYNPDYPYSNDITQAAEPVGTAPESPYKGTNVGNVVVAVENIIAPDKEYMSLEKQKSIVEQLRNSPDRVWHMDAFEKDGKYNCLRITNAGQVFLDVIKPGVHFSRVTFIHNHVKPDGMSEIIEYAKKQEWSKKLPEGFLPEGTTASEGEGQKFDSNGAQRQGAIYTFHRELELRNYTSSWGGLKLVWIGKHTNPSSPGSPFTVEDEFRASRFQ